jgi:hypothetical protein
MHGVMTPPGTVVIPEVMVGVCRRNPYCQFAVRHRLLLVNGVGVYFTKTRGQGMSVTSGKK